MGQVEASKPVAFEDVVEELAFVVNQRTDRVGNRHMVTCERRTATVSVVVDLLSCRGVRQDVAIRTAHIHRINRGHGVGHIEGIGRAGGIVAVLISRFGTVDMDESDVRTYCEPGSSLVF